MNNLNILLIEDDQIEILKFERILSTISKNHKQHNETNGEAALQYLKTTKNFPDLILLDLNMPKMNGLEFLKILKSDDGFHHIPVVVLTTSNNKEDIKEAYRIGIAGYVMKPLKYEAYTSQLKTIIEYWSINQLV
ncbi:response regulator [Winogradskyella haliclonae]|uniref:Response regulator n=1 Tax=Winogradskyella haliclonae TaxID=2048558 RepID=A0ABQ2BUN5_9FLAO|nr:response regulator [Winogradskyella haliclonae]GGI56179.1 response regulator [Winogradskyella haliclonae]